MENSGKQNPKMGFKSPPSMSLEIILRGFLVVTLRRCLPTSLGFFYSRA